MLSAGADAKSEVAAAVAGAGEHAGQGSGWHLIDHELLNGEPFEEVGLGEDGRAVQHLFTAGALLRSYPGLLQQGAIGGTMTRRALKHRGQALATRSKEFFRRLPRKQGQQYSAFESAQA